VTSTMNYLSVLSATGNGLDGTLPPGAIAKTAQTVSFSNNKLTGNLPTLTVNSDASSVTFQNNQFTGTIPTSHSRFVLATSLVYDQNQLTGNIPMSLNTLTTPSLRIRARTNKFNVEIPDMFAGWNNLVELDLADNDIPGTFPASLATLDNLVILNLFGNMMSGKLPSLKPATGLRTFDVSSNQFCGCWLDRMDFAGRTQFSCSVSHSSFCCESAPPNQCADAWLCENCTTLYGANYCADATCTYNPDKQPPVGPPTIDWETPPAPNTFPPTLLPQTTTGVSVVASTVAVGLAAFAAVVFA